MNALSNIVRLPAIISPRLPAVISLRNFSSASASFASATSPDSGGQQDAGDDQKKSKKKGRIHSKRSMKVELVGGKRYLWCACGYSQNQPFCDGTHLWRRWSLKIKQHPVMFKAPKDMKASLCLCKQTEKPPYCDGSHRKKEVQEAAIEPYP